MSTLDIDPNLLWCPRHVALVKNQPKPIQILISSRIFDALLAKPEFHKLCAGIMDNIQAQIPLIAPVCCYVGDDKVKLIILEASIGRPSKVSDTLARHKRNHKSNIRRFPKFGL